MSHNMLDLRILAAVSNAVSTEQTRYYLNGVSIECYADHTVYVATDGHMLLAARHDVQNDFTGSWIIPSDFCRHFKLAKPRRFTPISSLAKLERGEADRALSLAFEGASVSFEAVDGTFPDWRRVLPSKFGHSDDFHADARFLARMSKATLDIAPTCSKDKAGQFHIRQGEAGAPWLVTHSAWSDLELGFDMFGVVMPFRGKAPDAVPAWVNATSTSVPCAA